MRFQCAAIVLALTLAGARPLPGQQRPPAYELAGGFAAVGTRTSVYPCTYCPGQVPGFAVSFDTNIRSWFALDGQVDFLPQAGIGETSNAGGRTTIALFGARIGRRFRWGRGLLARQRLGLFFLLRPGVVSYGAAIVAGPPQLPGNRFVIGRKTYNALNYGGLALIRLSRHTGLRLELSDTFIFGQPAALGAPPAGTHNPQVGTSYVFLF